MCSNVDVGLRVIEEIPRECRCSYVGKGVGQLPVGPTGMDHRVAQAVTAKTAQADQRTNDRDKDEVNPHGRLHDDLRVQRERGHPVKVAAESVEIVRTLRRLRYCFDCAGRTIGAKWPMQAALSPAARRLDVPKSLVSWRFSVWKRS
jgi:hypothetical protein